MDINKLRDEQLAMDEYIRQLAIQVTLAQYDDVSESQENFGLRLLRNREQLTIIIDLINCVANNPEDASILAKHTVIEVKNLLKGEY